ncbi:glycerophosphodiester phosphodiesterase [Tepiditoga spiralis]|uniref:Glycerophosphodiester phosphodiesterase n=1 Tax=Tepiditoga spiralis TaxID=2108365 RepID=A0A7G1G8Q4_9BACT|nr:glycerophosphodiester phosphodiesterase family protein [Tepiditoga spiralis]BBE31347.1 glycerophosphodiester phosphodiesterase [Tepiditoga spiralis]
MSDNYPIIVLGHRGFRKLYPENTLIAYQKAIEFGADGVELDVRLSKDGSCVIMHDDNLERITGIEGKLKDIEYKEIRKIKLPMNQHIPTLEMVYSKLPEDTLINVEIKEVEASYTAYQIVKSFNAIERTLFSSFEKDAIIKIRELDDKAYVSYLIEEKEKLDEVFDLHAKINLYSVNLPAAGIKLVGLDNYKLYVSKLKEYDIKTILWNFDEISDVKKLKGYYDAIITDNVEDIVNELENNY